MVKTRSPIPPSISAHVLFISDHCCCACRERGRPVQIHHIDDNPTNHDLNNLAVLCLLCHEQTQIRGGFARKLGAEEVRLYRNDWHDRVQKRRDRADEVAALRQADHLELPTPTTSEEATALLIPADDALLAYVSTLPGILADACSAAREKWDSGVTAEMNNGFYDVIDVLQQIWIHLATWFPPSHFGSRAAPEYFSDYIGSRFEWQRALNEPAGVGTGGTIVGTLTAGAVLSDVEDAVEETVVALLLHREAFPLSEWRARWKASKKPS